MTDLPALSIVMVTYKRTDLAIRTIRSVSENLEYPKELISWHIGDDGSELEHLNAIVREIGEHCAGNLANISSERLRPAGQEKTYHCGMVWNRALASGFRYSNYVLFLEDDWELKRKFDIKPFVQMLSERQDVGMVRLGHLAVGSDVHIVGHNGVHYLQYQRTTQYAYSGNPQIRHQRFQEYYGYFSEEKNPGEIELDYDSRFREGVNGPNIWRPADIPGWGVFGHIGTDKSYA